MFLPMALCAIGANRQGTTGLASFALRRCRGANDAKCQGRSEQTSGDVVLMRFTSELMSL